MSLTSLLATITEHASLTNKVIANDGSIVFLMPKPRRVEMTSWALSHAIQHLAASDDSSDSVHSGQGPRHVLYIVRDKQAVADCLQQLLNYKENDPTTGVEMETTQDRLAAVLHGMPLTPSAKLNGIKAYLSRITIKYPQTIGELMALLASIHLPQTTTPTLLIIDSLSSWLIMKADSLSDESNTLGEFVSLELAARTMALAISAIRYLHRTTHMSCQLLTTDLLPLPPGKVSGGGGGGNRSSNERSASLYNVYKRWATRIYTFDKRLYTENGAL
ncbi:hypothetical protein BDF19DRAFT_445542, partial [Syncephalis fuscata]